MDAEALKRVEQNGPTLGRRKKGLTRDLTKEQEKMAETYCPELLKMYRQLQFTHYQYRRRHKRRKEVSGWIAEARREIAAELTQEEVEAMDRHRRGG